MKTFTKFTRAIMAFSLALLIFCARPVLADDPAPVPMATLTAKSLDATAALAKEIGVDLPPFLTAAGLEEQFSFIGKGGMAGDRPIGIVFFGSPGVAPQQMVTFILPVKPGAATLDSFKALGGQAMAGHADTIVLNGQVGLRRTGDYLVFSPSAVAVTLINVQEFADAVKSPDALAKLSIDMKGVRGAMAEVLKAGLDNMEKEATQNGDEIAKRVAGFGMNSIKTGVTTIDRVDVALEAGNEHARLSVSVSPSKIPAVTAGNKPGMPAGVVARVDVGAALGELVPAIREFIPAFIKSVVDKDNPGQPHTDEDKAQMRKVLTRIIALVTEPASTSKGFEVIGGAPVVYVVEHWSKPIDFPSEIREIVSTFNALLEKDKEPNHLSVQTYEAGGEKVLHVVAMEKEKPVGCLDVVQHGSDVFMTISPSLEHHISALANAPQEGPIKDLITGSIDLGGVIDALGAIPDSPVAEMPPELKKQFSEIFHGRKVHIAVTAHGETATLEVKFDRALLQQIGSLLKKQ